MKAVKKESPKRTANKRTKQSKKKKKALEKHRRRVR